MQSKKKTTTIVVLVFLILISLGLFFFFKKRNSTNGTGGGWTPPPPPIPPVDGQGNLLVDQVPALKTYLRNELGPEPNYQSGTLGGFGILPGSNSWLPSNVSGGISFGGGGLFNFQPNEPPATFQEWIAWTQRRTELIHAWAEEAWPAWHFNWMS